MPEIKNTFLQGKMNKDLDERLIPNGQYRNAENVEVSTAEGSNAGTVKNILGNKRVDAVGNFPGVPPGFKCVGSIANEKTNKIYWFVSKINPPATDNKDAIIEYDVEHDIAVPVLVDLNAGEHNAVLKFYGNIITGINIIDDLLFWTDNNSDPKKINIKECIRGTVDFDTHTQLLFEHGSFDGITIKLVSPWSGASASHSVYFQPPHYKIGRYVWVEEKQLNAILGVEVGSYSSGTLFNVRHYRNGKYLGIKQIKVYHGASGTRFRLSTGTNAELNIWQVGDVIFGSGVNLDIEERHITVIKPKPLNTFSVKINHTQNLDGTSNIPNLFETKFPRFSYRYKYRDGEFSPFAPFTNPVFNPRYTKDINNSSGVNVYYNKDTIYDIKEPHNKAMINSIHSVELTDFVTVQTPENVVEIDILYKQEDSPVIYSISTIKQIDSEWHDLSNYEGLGLNLGVGKSNLASGAYKAIGGYTKGKYTVTTENIYAALPANQLLRPWDNVPRKALAQEVTGNRVVYGNYLQNYDLGVVKPKVKVNYGDRSNQIGSFETQGLPSIKSLRNYQLGVVYCDKQGRETPVFTSDEGAINIPWQESDGIKNASKSLQLNTSVVSNFPAWVDSLKFFVKETANEYYNLTMDRAWVTKETYELDNSEGHLWISFPSSDRNKISEEDYIILKKKIGVGEEQVDFENKFKVIDIKNEAPDAIKYELVNYGVINNQYVNSAWSFAYGNSTTITTGLFPIGNNSQRIDKEVDTIRVGVDLWNKWVSTAAETFGQIPLEEDVTNSGEDGALKTKDLYVSWRRLDSTGVGVSSKKYKVTGGSKLGSWHTLKLATHITKIDADIAHETGSSTALGGNAQENFHPDLIFQIEKKELKNTEDFSGKFFVKISKNQITNLIESGEPVSILDKYQISAKAPTWYWQDDYFAGNVITINQDGSPTSNYGLTNWGGSSQNPGTGVNSIQNAQNNDVGNVTADSKTLRVTDWYGAWDGILTKHSSIGQFFVDAMHVASGQSGASNYAKYNYIPWSGCTKDESATKEDSAWSYPPLKTWLTDFKDKTELLESLEDDDNTNWYNGNLISTSLSSQITSTNRDWSDLRVDGWIGSLQNVSRDHPTSQNTPNQINGLEGFVTTSSVHAVGPRRWFSGITSSSIEHGVGVDTKTYSDDGEVGRHFMHLSFFAPGKDLHDDDFTGVTSDDALYGDESWAANLQGIWGGGHFTGEKPGDTFGTGTEGFQHLCMESNNDSSGAFLEATPAPGVGYGYDIKYREEHERQWDPTFGGDGDPDNKIRDFIRNLYPGSQFKFHIDSGEEVYTIKKVVVKKLYNHTSWRKPYNRYINGSGTIGIDYGYIHGSNIATEDPAYRSVEQCGLEWLAQVDDTGNYTGTTNPTQRANLEDQIVNFGKASNRRVCYIIELDKNPADISTQEGGGFNPISNSDVMCADIAGGDFANIEFLEPVQSVLLSDLSKFPAVWEVDPKKKEVDLDIYYEASSNIPIKINSNTNELFAPIGCKVEVIDSAITGTARLESWDGAVATFDPGFEVFDGIDEINYAGISFKFTREDGGFTIAEAGEQVLTGVTSYGYKTEFGFREDIGDTIRTGLSWYNCFSFGNGLESNRIRDDFNEMFITNGVKASTTTQETYEEERRAHGLIYSGLYNSNSGVNDLNQFIMAEKITKDLNPTYGSIQKLFQRRISLIAFCEDRVLSITSNKDAIYNADGSPQLISTANVLGDVNPFVGDFGISKNPESFASESYRAYFTDKQRGTVLRLSKDGLTPISKAGMHDWFRDNLSNYTSLIGTYDSYKEDYNLTLANTFGENILYGSAFDIGTELVTTSGGIRNIIENPGIFDGTSFQFPYEPHAQTLPTSFGWGSVNANLISNATITNHEPIFQGELQPYVAPVTAITGIAPILEVWTVFDPFTGTAVISFTGSTAAAQAQAYVQAHPGFGAVPLQPVVFNSNLPNSGGSLDGQFWAPDFEAHYYNIWGPWSATGGFSTAFTDPNIWANVRRHMGNSYVDESNQLAHPQMNNPGWNMSPAIDKPIVYGRPWATGNNSYHSQAITRGELTNSSGLSLTLHENGGQFLLYPTKAIVFDRVSNESNAWIECQSVGQHPPGYASGGVGELNAAYSTLAGISNVDGEEHNAIYNGDEIIVQFELTCFKTLEQTSSQETKTVRFGYNYITPKVEIFDGATAVSSDKLMDIGYLEILGGTRLQSQHTGHPDPYRYIQNPPGGGGSTGFPGPVQAGNTWYTNTSGNFGNSTTDYFSAPLIYSGTSAWSFPNTTNVGEMTILISSSGNASTRAAAAYNDPSRTFLCQIAYKFRDPNQQSPNGRHLTAGFTIQAMKVVNNLRVRISQTELPGGSVWEGPYYDDDNLEHPLWAINNIKIVKSSGVVQGMTFPVAATAPQSSQTVAPTFYNINGIAQVDPVPPHDVPAWTEVIHNNASWFDDWTVTNTGGGNVTYLHAHTGNNSGGAYPSEGLGNTYSHVDQTGLEANPNDDQVFDPTPSTTVINYKVPQDWGFGTTISTSGYFLVGSGSGISLGSVGLIETNFNDTSGSPPVNGTPFFHSTNHVTGILYPLIGSGTPGNPLSGSVEDFPNEWWYTKTSSMNTNIEIRQNISSSPWEIGKWYLVDVEYDEIFNANTGAGHGNVNGSFFLYGMGSFSGFNWGAPISLDGVGIYRGNSTTPHVQLVQVDRTEYGTPQRVLRAIFKVPAVNDSWITNTSNTARLESFKLQVYGCTNGVRITKIISKKLDTLTSTGTVADWVSSYSGGTITQLHSFDNKELYYKNLRLCFEVRDDQVDKTYKWIQTGLDPTALVSTPLGWTLSFTVDDNPVTSSFDGELRGWVAPADATKTLYFEGIDTEGNYEINFDIEASSGNWTINGPSGHGATISAGGTNTGNATGEIGFASDVDTVASPTGALALGAGINNIILTDNTEVLQGGSAGSWSFNGFNTSIDDYMHWDNTPGNERLKFLNCPTTDPTVTTSIKQLINANQWIDKPIKRHEQYRIIFDYSIHLADIVVYYFNSEGYGFRITSIGANQPINTTGTSTITGTYNEIHTIGDAIWDSEYPTTSGEYVPQLKNTFVIRKSHGSNLLNGYIDNISMVRVFDLILQPEKTLSFSEDVNGWTSFKSFGDGTNVLESGVSISKKYFTMFSGGLFQHYVPMVYAPIYQGFGSEWTDEIHTDLLGTTRTVTAEEAENYNRFYGIPYSSSITAVLNGDPSTVKTFNTLNYEGSQAQVIKPLSLFDPRIIDPVTGQPLHKLVNINNAQAWNSGGDIDGWNCTEIKTDMDTGSIVEFIKKEGKWFNYIKGKPTSLSDIGDTSRFSVQGIGEASAVTEVTYP